MANVKGLKDVKEENDDEKRQAYYAGGQGQNGGGSGQEILDPTEFMKRARDEMGAQSVDDWRAQQPSTSSAFTGAGQALNGAAVDGAAAPKPPQEHTITFWQNGFSVDDGPLRKAEDPENAAFLNDVNRGRMPAELMTDGEPDGDVHIINRSTEPYVPPPVTLKPFSGEGRSMREEPSADAPAAPALGAGEELVVDASAPTTTLQVRLADGSRKVVKANQSHTVLQLYGHVATLTPGASFELMAGFPPKKLTEMEKTLAEAGLLSESITQKTV